MNKQLIEQALLWFANYVHHDFTYLTTKYGLCFYEKLTVETIVKYYQECKDIGKDIEITKLPETPLGQACEIFLREGSCGTSMLQRYMGVGYAAATGLMNHLFELNIIGPEKGIKVRELLITDRNHLYQLIKKPIL